MKKLLIIAILSLALLGPRSVSAAVYVPANNTNPLSPTSSAPVSADSSAQTTPVPGQIGGTQNTNPQNTSTVSNLAAINAITTNANNPATTCSHIQFNTLLDIAIWAKCIIGAVIIPGIFSLAFVVFLWGVFKFIRSSDLKDKQDSKQFIYMGLIGLFVMVSVWGIIRIATNTFGLDSTVPLLPTGANDPLSIKKASTTKTPVPVPSSTGTGSN